MRFLLDENIGKRVGLFLQGLDHAAFRVKEINPGVDDYEVLHLAISNDAILVTADKDFGELIFKEHQRHVGVILLRLNNQTSTNKIKALVATLTKYPKLGNKFFVVSEKEHKFMIRTGKLDY